MNNYGGGGGGRNIGAPAYKQYAVEGEKVVQKIRDALEKRGSRTIRSLGKAFQLMDNGNNKDRKLDPEEFAIGMREQGVNLTQTEVSLVLKYLDKDGDGTINYDEFLYAIRGKPNQVRQNIIERAYKLLDKDGSGVIDKADLCLIYDVTKHPKFNKGKTKEQIQDELLENFGDVNRDGTISHDEWNDYYAAVSASVDNDDHFVMLMQSAWKMK